MRPLFQVCVGLQNDHPPLLTKWWKIVELNALLFNFHGESQFAELLGQNGD